jgi:hypothetical protein
MAATLHVLRPKPAPLAGFLRVGHTGHHKLIALHAAGRLPYRRVVFDAAHVDEQVELLKLLRSSGCEIVLDPNFDEMAVIGRYQTAVSQLPWANPTRPWEPSDFGRGRNADIAKMIAECAVRHGANVVLAPTHLVETVRSNWQAVDYNLCERLREELDHLGGQSIAIDYQLITSWRLVSDDQHNSQLIGGLTHLPIENVWLRVSGFSATATGARTRHILEAIRAFHELQKPIVADNVGGLPGLAALAFGAVAGIGHGVAQREGFDAYPWNHPQNRKGGSKRRIYIPELDRYLTEDQLTSLFSTRGGKSKFACNDTTCCANIDAMLDSPHAHFITQRDRQINDLSNVEELRRAEHFLLNHVSNTVRSARYGSNLKNSDPQIKKLMIEARGRLVRLSDVLTDMHTSANSVSRSRPIKFRGGGGAISAVLGR